MRDVVAVFEIHIEINAVTSKKANKINLGRVPANINSISAILLCRLYFSIAVATTKPPKNRKVESFMYSAATSLAVEIPLNNNKINNQITDKICCNNQKVGIE